jgi:hypothetical protein
MGFVRRLQTVDRRLVYLLLVGVLSLPFVVTYSLPIYPDTYTTRFFDQLERIGADPAVQDKVVLVLSNWGPGTGGENEPQFRMVLRHLLRRRIRFVFLCSAGDPLTHDNAMASFRRAQEAEILRARRMGEPIPTWTYGEDYLDFGYKNCPLFAPFARTIILDPRGFFERDFVNRRSLLDDQAYPLLRHLHGISDVAAVITISAGDEAKYIAGLVKGDHPDLLIAPATMGIVANELYPYVKSGQLFGLLNSARAAMEYRALLDPGEPTTTARDNGMSLGKSLLLLLVLLGNVAYLTTRWAERTGRLPALDRRAFRPPMPPLPKKFMWGLFVACMALFATAAAYDFYRYSRDHTLARLRIARPDDDLAVAYSRYERVGFADIKTAVETDVQRSDDPLAARFVERQAEQRWSRMIEGRIGDYFIAFFTLGVFAFLLGDNKFYRFIEAIIIGGSLGLILDTFRQILWPDWIAPMLGGAQATLQGIQDWLAHVRGIAVPPRPPGPHWSNIFWALLVVPGALWYFTYSKKYRWLNQLIVAVFIGLMVGPEFQNQTNLLIPQVLDTIQPVWPWGVTNAAGVVDHLARIEHLVFVVVAVLSLTYFIFFFRPKTRAGTSAITLGRLFMMIGFGAMFGNAVNTRLSWLSPRVSTLIEDWLGKLFGG